MKKEGDDSAKITLFDTILLAEKNNGKLHQKEYIDLNIRMRLNKIMQTQKGGEKMIGFRIYEDGHYGDDFYSNDSGTLEKWVKMLSKRVSLDGFSDYFKLEHKIGKGGFSSIYEI